MHENVESEGAGFLLVVWLAAATGSVARWHERHQGLGLYVVGLLHNIVAFVMC